ncbi:MAG: DUF362 domain-containing protein, partial [Candidatus Obscuribacterales bacterium]|nr:DUF362 domain-containing protein [Candidatus Obscuribacterales bacterium]
GIIAMEGDGPINGTAKKMQALVLGDDLVAVDTVCGLSMELPVQNIPYLKLGGMVLGNNDLSQIDVVGTSIEAIKKKFVLPPTYESNGKLKKMSSAEDAASGMT